jgi:hypothetical protein
MQSARGRKGAMLGKAFQVICNRLLNCEQDTRLLLTVVPLAGCGTCTGSSFGPQLVIRKQKLLSHQTSAYTPYIPVQTVQSPRIRLSGKYLIV